MYSRYAVRVTALLVSICIAAFAAENLALNGGFETGMDAPANWVAADAAVGAVFTRDTSLKRSGVSSGKIAVPASEKKSWPAYELTIPVAAGEAYIAAAYIMTECEQQGSARSFAYLSLEFQSYSLFSRFAPAGSQVMTMECDEPDGLIKTSAVKSGNTTSIFVLNSAWNDQAVIIDAAISGKYSRYIFNKASSVPNAPEYTMDKEGSFTGVISDTVPRQSLVVYRCMQ